MAGDEKLLPFRFGENTPFDAYHDPIPFTDRDEPLQIGKSVYQAQKELSDAFGPKQLHDPVPLWDAVRTGFNFGVDVSMTGSLAEEYLPKVASYALGDEVNDLLSPEEVEKKYGIKTETPMREHVAAEYKRIREENEQVQKNFGHVFAQGSGPIALASLLAMIGPLAVEEAALWMFTGGIGNYVKAQAAVRAASTSGFTLTRVINNAFQKANKTSQLKKSLARTGAHIGFDVASIEAAKSRDKAIGSDQEWYGAAVALTFAAHFGLFGLGQAARGVKALRGGKKADAVADTVVDEVTGPTHVLDDITSTEVTAVTKQLEELTKPIEVTQTTRVWKNGWAEYLNKIDFRNPKDIWENFSDYAEAVKANLKGKDLDAFQAWADDVLDLSSYENIALFVSPKLDHVRGVAMSALYKTGKGDRYLEGMFEMFSTSSLMRKFNAATPVELAQKLNSKSVDELFEILSMDSRFVTSIRKQIQKEADAAVSKVEKERTKTVTATQTLTERSVGAFDEHQNAMKIVAKAQAKEKASKAAKTGEAKLAKSAAEVEELNEAKKVLEPEIDTTRTLTLNTSSINKELDDTMLEVIKGNRNPKSAGVAVKNLDELVEQRAGLVTSSFRLIKKCMGGG